MAERRRHGRLEVRAGSDGAQRELLLPVMKVTASILGGLLGISSWAHRKGVRR